MQSYDKTSISTAVSGSLELLLAATDTVRSCQSGTAFPTNDLQIGMLCYRTDLRQLHVLEEIESTPTWTLVCDFTKTLLYQEDADALYAALVHQHEWADIIGGTTPTFQTLTVEGDTTLNGQSIRTPNKPCFSAILTADAVTATGDLTEFYFANMTEKFDQGDCFDATTGIFTAPVDGIYQFDATTGLQFFASGHTSGYIAIYAPVGTNFCRGSQFNPYAYRDAVNDACLLSMTFKTLMNAGDTARVGVTVGNAAKTVNVVGLYTQFAGELVA